MCVYGGVGHRRAPITEEFKNMLAWDSAYKNCEIKESNINPSGFLIRTSWIMEKKTHLDPENFSFNLGSSSY